MQFKSIYTLLAFGLSLVMADDETTTSTSTLTQTVTITQCNPTVTDCPGYPTTTSTSTLSSSSSWAWHLTNSTVPAGPTAGWSNSSSIVVIPTSHVTSIVQATPTKATTSTSSIPTSGASGLIMQSGLLLTILGAGMALVA
ncbi:hypothetical protein B0H67DRAFT_564908 [Lasiosphaeris hirsuta]|uniref:GPI anchored protein n=1 Tax=Lasiosphaeris hirsuta TaxID=260670 RepID=A0AA40BC03_9PEZI|nr:hypothetical protein B0H67DRAFT_564908 [Lasiosphaeris hirsuta]